MNNYTSGEHCQGNLCYVYGLSRHSLHEVKALYMAFRGTKGPLWCYGVIVSFLNVFYFLFLQCERNIRDKLVNIVKLKRE